MIRQYLIGKFHNAGTQLTSGKTPNLTLGKYSVKKLLSQRTTKYSKVIRKLIITVSTSHFLDIFNEQVWKAVIKSSPFDCFLEFNVSAIFEII